MLKKWTFIITIISIITFGLYVVPDSLMETINVSANYIEANTYEELEEMADLIVVAKATKPFTKRNHVIKYMKDNKGNNLQGITDMFTRTEIVINQVLKQPEGENYKPYDEMLIIEPITYDSMRKAKISLAHYVELKDNELYIIFLAKNTYGNYSVINMNNGKFKMETLKNRPTEEPVMNLHHKLSNEIYKRFKNQLQ
jgi:ribosomal protein L2